VGLADRFLLSVANRKGLGVDVTRAVLGVERGGSMEGYPTVSVTLDDPREELMQSDLLTRPAVRPLGTAAASALRPVDVLLDGVWYRLRQAQRTGDGVVLTFNHRGAVFMGNHDSAISASRAESTRALFVRRQVVEAGRSQSAAQRLAFWAWEVNRRMPLAKATDSLSARADPARDAGSIADAAKQGKDLKLRGQPTTAGQRLNMAKAMREANNAGASAKPTIALSMACIVEPPDFKNPTGGDASSVGILQLLASHLGGSKSVDGGRRDVALVCRLFLLEGFAGNGGAIELARTHPGATPGEIAQMVQGSQFPARYDAVRKDAEAVVAAFGGTNLQGNSGESYVKPSRFRRPRGEDAWTNTGKIADEVKRRRFITIPQRGSDVFMYGADADFLRLQSQATFTLDASYVVAEPEYDLDYGKTIRAMRLQVIGDAFDTDFAWGLPVTLTDAGAVTGKWLVWEVHEVDGSPIVELDLRMPQEPAGEPRAEAVQRANSSDSSPDADGTAVGKFVARAKAISDRGYPYVWGGGHAKVGVPDHGTGRDPGTGFDCSGYIGACAFAAGMWPDAWGKTVPVSGEWASWGESGKGNRLTVWSNATHVFAEVNLHGEKVRYVDTSRQAGGAPGPHVRYGSRSTAGFTPSHWPGN
jgi:hypothetical protein